MNIPRYVDTFEEEEPINLDEVSAALKALDSEMLLTDESIKGFCDELDIPAPF